MLYCNLLFREGLGHLPSGTALHVSVEGPGARYAAVASPGQRWGFPYDGDEC